MNGWAVLILAVLVVLFWEYVDDWRSNRKG